MRLPGLPFLPTFYYIKKSLSAKFEVTFGKLVFCSN